MSKSKQIQEELTNIATIGLAIKATNRLEKIFWMLIALFGAIWGFYFITHQISLLSENPSHITKADIDLSGLKYPAITICSESSNKFSVAERIGNYLNLDFDNQYFLDMKRMFLNCAIKKELGGNKDLFYSKCYDNSTQNYKNFQNEGCKV